MQVRDTHIAYRVLGEPGRVGVVVVAGESSRSSCSPRTGSRRGSWRVWPRWVVSSSSTSAGSGSPIDDRLVEQRAEQYGVLPSTSTRRLALTLFDQSVIGSESPDHACRRRRDDPTTARPAMNRDVDPVLGEQLRAGESRPPRPRRPARVRRPRVRDVCVADLRVLDLTHVEGHRSVRYSSSVVPVFGHARHDLAQVGRKAWLLGSLVVALGFLSAADTSGSITPKSTTKSVIDQGSGSASSRILHVTHDVAGRHAGDPTPRAWRSASSGRRTAPSSSG